MAVKYEQGKEPQQVDAPEKLDPNELDDKSKKRTAKNKARTSESK